MKPPRSLKVGPHKYKVTLVPDGILTDSGNDGTCTPQHLAIGLDATQPPSMLGDTLCHEITHAMLATVGLEAEVEERVALVFGPALYALICENPKLLRYLTSTQESE